MMYVNGLQIPSHNHVTVLQHVSNNRSTLKSQVDPPVRKKPRRGLFIHPSLSFSSTWTTNINWAK